MTLNSALLEDDEMKFVISSFHEELRGLSSIVPTNLEHVYALKDLASIAHQEYNKMFSSTITPSKITTKRRCSFLSPINKKKKCGRDLKSRKDKPQFEKVGRIHANKRSMNEQLESTSRKQRDLEHAHDVQHSILHNIGI